MALPNMAMIPSGYKPTKLYSVLPTETLGSELVTSWTNKDFSAFTSSGSTITQMVSSGSGQNCYSLATFESGKTYKLKFTSSQSFIGQIRISPNSNLTSGQVVLSNPILGLNEISFTPLSNYSHIGFYSGSVYSDTQIEVFSVKEVLVGNADFDVTRATPATRVNQQGLIETPEFIESGDLVTNGDFDTDSDWAKNPNWTISGGTANCDGTSDGTLFQNNVIEDNKEYSISYTISNLTQGKINISLSGTDGVKQDSNGTYTEVIKSGTSPSGRLSIECSSSPICSIDNVSVIQVERNNIPRLDYTDGTCPVLLTEPESTNLAIYSNDFSKWAKLSSLSTVTLNSIISPDGTVNGVKQTQIVANNSARLRLNPVVVAGKKYTFSIYAKKGNHDKLIMNISGINTIFTLTDDWARYEITETATGTFVDAGISQGVVNDFIYMYGAQVEELPYSTSIIPTNGSTVTRNQDIVNNAGTSATYNSTEGTLFVEVAALSDDNTDRKLVLSDGSLNNSVAIGFSRFSGNINAIINSGGTLQTSGFGATGVTQTNNNKFALSWGNGVAKFYANGVLASSYTSITSPIGLSVLDFSLSSGFEKFFCKTSQVQVFNTALSNFDLQNLTSNATAYATYETMRTSLNFNIQ